MDLNLTMVFVFWLFCGDILVVFARNSGLARCQSGGDPWFFVIGIDCFGYFSHVRLVVACGGRLCCARMASVRSFSSRAGPTLVRFLFRGERLPTTRLVEWYRAREHLFGSSRVGAFLRFSQALRMTFRSLERPVIFLSLRFPSDLLPGRLACVGLVSFRGGILVLRRLLRAGGVIDCVPFSGRNAGPSTECLGAACLELFSGGSYPYLGSSRHFSGVVGMALEVDFFISLRFFGRIWSWLPLVRMFPVVSSWFWWRLVIWSPWIYTLLIEEIR